MSEHDDEVRGGYPAGAPHPRRNGLLPEDSANSALPADLAAVQADDALLDALRGPNPSPEGSDARLTQVLMAWRGEIDSEPVTRVMDTDTALAVVARAQRPAPRRNSVLVPFAAAAAVLAIAFSGVGIGARAAEPGDRLWPLTKVLYSDDAAVKTRDQLEQADTALAEGRPEEADAVLLNVDQQLAAMPPDDEDRAELEAKRDELRQRLKSQPNTDDGTGAPNSDKLDRSPVQDVPPAVERSSGPSGGEMLESPGEPEQPGSGDSEPGPANPQSGPANPEPGTGGTGGGGAGTGNYPGTTSRYAPPPPPPPPPPPVAPAPPESFPGS